MELIILQEYCDDHSVLIVLRYYSRKIFIGATED